MAKEIESRLQGMYVKNIYSLGGSQVFRFGRGDGEDSWLVASPRYGTWVSTEVAEREETTEFTTSLRRLVGRAKLVSARQVDLDRIFDFTFGEEGGGTHLIVELMPPGNLVVTDRDGRVLLALHEVRSPIRRLVRGGAYAAPRSLRKSPAEATPADVTSGASKEKTAGGAIGRTFSIPRKYVAEVLARAGVAEDAPSSALAGKEEQVVSGMLEIVREAGANPSPCSCATPRGEEIFVIEPTAFAVKKRARTVSELCDALLLAEASAGEEVSESPSESRRKELEVTISRLKAQEEGLLAEAARVRELAARARSAGSAEEAVAALKEGGVHLRNRGSSREAVASALFDRAKELERKAGDSRKAIADLSKRKPAKPGTAGKRTVELRREKKEWYEKFRWFFTSGGKLAIGGRDAQSNSVLVKRHLDSNDTVYHADLFGSPFFVLKGGKEQTDEERAEVAQATVAFSSAWKTGLGSADAYWVNSDQVSTSAPSGEFLPKGGFLIRGKKNFVTHNLVELAVGIDESGRVVAGPEAALGRSAAAYVIIRPHREKGSETAKKIAKDLEALSGGRPSARVSVDDTLRALPAGGGKVLRRHAGPQTTEPRNA